MLAGLQAELLRPETIQYVTNALAAALNRVIDERPQRRRALEDARAATARKLTNLVTAIESGTSAPALLEALNARQAELARLDADLGTLNEPLDDKLAVMPHWVRRQLEDVAGLLGEVPERAKTEFKRLGIQFTLHPVYDEGTRPFLRAVGSGEFVHLASSPYLALSTTDRSDLRSGR